MYQRDRVQRYARRQVYGIAIEDAHSPQRTRDRGGCVSRNGVREGAHKRSDSTLHTGRGYVHYRDPAVQLFDDGSLVR